MISKMCLAKNNFLLILFTEFSIGATTSEVGDTRQRNNLFKSQSRFRHRCSGSFGQSFEFRLQTTMYNNFLNIELERNFHFFNGIVSPRYPLPNTETEQWMTWIDDNMAHSSHSIETVGGFLQGNFTKLFINFQ
jgi:hypothetical protein